MVGEIRLNCCHVWPEIFFNLYILILSKASPRQGPTTVLEKRFHCCQPCLQILHTTLIPNNQSTFYLIIKIQDNYIYFTYIQHEFKFNKVLSFYLLIIVRYDCNQINNLINKAWHLWWCEFIYILFPLIIIHVNKFILRW